MRLLPLALIALLASSCSAISANREIADAQGALQAAEQAGAPRFAIYEYTAAIEYLHKAREENNYSDYDAARSYAGHARELAQEARARADRQSGRGGVGQSDEVVDQAAGDRPPGVTTEADENAQDGEADDPTKRSKGGKRR